MGETPDPGWTTRGIISRVIDGDTVEVTIKRTIRVRLQDCWAPETRLDPGVPPIDREAAKLRGIASAEYLRRIADGRECTLHIPTHPADNETQDIGDSFSMGRAVRGAAMSERPGGKRLQRRDCGRRSFGGYCGT